MVTDKQVFNSNLRNGDSEKVNPGGVSQYVDGGFDRWTYVHASLAEPGE
jgi:hypothetical protein